RVWEILDALVAKSVLDVREHAGQIRYRMLETLREYGRHRLREAGHADELRRRHADWYLALAERGEREWFGPTGIDLLLRLHAEHANLRAALDFYLGASGEPVLGRRLAPARRCRTSPPPAATCSSAPSAPP